MLAGKNVLIIAPTGCGKTEAAMLPIFNMMLCERPKPVSVLYITPLKALINDIVRRLRWWAKRLGFRVARKHGDVPSSEKASRLRRTPDIMVMTPESLEIDLDWASRFREYLANVRWVVIDEVHELVSSKRGVQLAVLLERLKEITGYDFQRIGLSATIGDPEETLDFLCGSSGRPKSIVRDELEKPISISIHAIPEDSEDLWEAAARVVTKVIEPPSLIFVNSRFSSERLHEALERLGLRDIWVHHSSVSREVRSRVEELLKAGALKAVVCTKTLELGIDVGDIKTVVQFRPPGSASALLQRIGRSGHEVNSESKGAIICIGALDVLESLATAILVSEGRVEKPVILRKPMDVLAREVLGMCLQYGRVSLDKMYKVFRGAYPFKDLTINELAQLLEYLRARGLIVEDDGYFKIGPGFYRIWRFDYNGNERKWWARSFTEFFTLIGERSTFTVKCGDRHIGDLDSAYVFRYLRVGDVIRLSGRSWRVIDIDDNMMRVEVVAAEPGEDEVPLWRGEGIRRHGDIAAKACEVLEKAFLGGLTLPPNVKADELALKELVSLAHSQAAESLLPSRNTMVIERVGDETYFLMFMDQRVADTLAHIVMYIISSKYTMRVSIKSSYLGFYVKSPGVDPVKVFLQLTPELVRGLAKEALMRSPMLYAVVKEIQVSFGRVGKVSPDSDGIILEEALNQLLSTYFDVEGAAEVVRGVKEGRVRVVVVERVRPSPLARLIARMPAERPWVKDATILIVKTLDGIALTPDELAEILGLPAKTIEAKLKELRRPNVKDRVFQFMDVELGEWRWALIKDANLLMSSPEYEHCFKPLDLCEAFTLAVRPLGSSSHITLFFTPKEVLEDPKNFIAKVGVDEAYEVRVLPLSDSLLKSLAPRYYYVPSRVLPLVVLNGVAYLQTLKYTST